MARRKAPSQDQLGLIFLVNPKKASGQAADKQRPPTRKKNAKGRTKKGKSKRTSGAAVLRTYQSKKGHRYELRRLS